MGGKWFKDVLWPLAITLTVVIVVSCGYLTGFPFLEELELKAFDLRLRARGPIATSEQVSIVAIDEESLEKIGRWPWSRDVMAKLARKIDSHSPRAVGYDISFFDSQENPAQNEILLLAKHAAELGIKVTPELMGYLKNRLTATNADLQLALALQNATSPQILGYYFNLASDAQRIEHTLDRAASYPIQKTVKNVEIKEPPVPRARKARTNIEILARAASSQAFFNILPDGDGTIRRYPLTMSYGGQFYQPLAAALACLTDSRKPPTILLGPLGLMGVELGDRFVPSDESGRVILNYRGPEKTIAHVPAWKILQGTAEKDLLTDKFLMVGVTAPAVYDLRVTPYGVAYPGLEVQATALDNILQQDFIRKPGWAPLFDLTAIIGLGLVCLLFLWRMNPVGSVFGFVILFAGYLVVNQYFFVQRLYWLNLIYPLTTFLTCYLGLNVYRFIFADKQKRQIRQAFSKYLDPHVVEDVVDDPEKLRLGGVKQDLTVLFSDIRGFTSISERLSPEALVRLLNDYLTEMTGIVMARRGLLDKYIGDAVMAVFGAPRHYPDHARMGCLVALEMIERLEKLNDKWMVQDWGKSGPPPPLRIGVGVNTGPMVAGNMGSRDRFDYTVMGDNVNLGSRLEGLNKVYKTQIIISQATLDQLGDGFWVRCLDRVRVKGKGDPVAIYELLGKKIENVACPLGYLAEYEEARRLYEQGHFREADRTFAGLQKAAPLDPVISLYRTRLGQLMSDPPETWDGVYTFTTK
jgi:adenylate cyclase